MSKKGKIMNKKAIKSIKYLLTATSLGIILSFSNNLYASSFSKVAENTATDFYIEGMNNIVEGVTDEASSAIQQIGNKGKKFSLNNTTQEEVKTTKPGTARQQGYISPEEQEKKIAKKNLKKQLNTPMQQGIQAHSAYEGSPISKNAKNKMLIKNWAYILQDVGVSKEKTYFEANRLNKEDFEEWANGIYNALKNK